LAYLRRWRWLARTPCSGNDYIPSPNGHRATGPGGRVISDADFHEGRQYPTGAAKIRAGPRADVTDAPSAPRTITITVHSPMPAAVVSVGGQVHSRPWKCGSSRQAELRWATRWTNVSVEVLRLAPKKDEDRGRN
jgi:hypothetical protein